MKRSMIPVMTVLISILLLFSGCDTKEQHLEIGLFSGSVWGVPYWQSYTFFDQAIERYTELHPNVTISYRSGTMKENYSEWISQEILHGREPDLFLVRPEDFSLFARLGILEDLDDHMEEGFESGLYYHNAIEAGRFEQGQFGFPLEVVPTLMFVNQTILSENAISLPDNDWTWEEFYEICYTLKDHPSIKAVEGFDWRLAAFTNGQQLFSDNGTRAYLTEDGVLEAVTFIGKLNAVSPPDDSFYFEDGNVAFAPLPFSEYRAYAYYPYSIQKYKNFDWEALLLPRGPDGQNGADLQSLLVSMSSRSRKKELAWDFLHFLISDPEIQKSVFTYSHGVPILKEILELDETRIFLSRGKDTEAPLLSPEQITQSIENSLVFPRFEKYEEAVSLIERSLAEIEQNASRLKHQLSIINIDLNDFLTH
jgi:multiple sugar transport system substrate-binding protein